MSSKNTIFLKLLNQFRESPYSLFALKVWQNYPVKIILIFFIFFSTTCHCSAQNSLEVTSLFGKKVFADGTIPLEGNSYGFEVAYNIFQKKRPVEWVENLHIRDISIVAGYRDMRNVYISDSITSRGFLGTVYMLSSRLNINIFNINKTEVLFIAGAGILYSSSSFFKDKNPIVGSNVNFSPYAGIKIKRPLSKLTSLTAGIDIFHYSNIGFKIPNKGVNSINLSFGIVKDLKYKAIKYGETDSIKSFIDLGGDVGNRGAYQSNSQNWKNGLSVAYNYKFNSVFSLKTGLDGVYYYKTFDNTSETFQNLATSYSPWRVGVSLGTDLWLGNFVIMGSYGYYLKFDSYSPVKNYSTAGFKYYFNAWIGAQYKMYFHKTQADYLGLGLVFRVPTKKFKY